MARDRAGKPPSRRSGADGERHDDEASDEPVRPAHGPVEGGLLAALDEYHSGHKDLHDAAREAGVEAWDLLQAVQATPDPIGRLDEHPAHLRPFVRLRQE